MCDENKFFSLSGTGKRVSPKILTKYNCYDNYNLYKRMHGLAQFISEH